MNESPLPNGQPIVCVIAGSDCSGSAGLQGDLKTATQLDVYAATVVTAVTAQNSCDFDISQAVPPQLVKTQYDAIARDFVIGAIKIGMLADMAQFNMLQPALAQHRASGNPIVFDPVLKSSTGGLFQKEDYASQLGSVLPAQIDLLTPNLEEARVLGAFDKIAATVDEGKTQTQALAEKFQCAVYLKGGHLEGEWAIDVFTDGDQIQIFTSPMIPTRNLRGTGCAFSTAVAAYWVQGLTTIDAVAKAKDIVRRFIQEAQSDHLGQCGGPLGHWKSSGN